MNRIAEGMGLRKRQKFHADRTAHALANQDVGAKLINLSTVESDIPLAAAERKMGRALETLAGLAGTQVCQTQV